MSRILKILTHSFLRIEILQRMDRLLGPCGAGAAEKGREDEGFRCLRPFPPNIMAMVNDAGMRRR